MKLPVRILSCLLLCCFSTTLFAQSDRSLVELQTQAKQQTEMNPWIKKYLITTAVGIGVGGAGWMAVNNLRLRHQKRALQNQTEELQKALQDYRYEVRTLRDQRASLVHQRDKALDLWEQANNMLERQKKERPLIPSKTATKPTAEGYKYLAKTDLSKRLLAEKPYQFSYLSDQEIRSVLWNLDHVSQNQSAQKTLMELSSLIGKAPNISVKQLYIQAGRYVKVIAIVGIFSALITPTKSVAAQTKLNRLESNPALFLQADKTQLEEWEKDPRANTLCRQIAAAIDQAASLQVQEEEAQALTQQAAEQHLLQAAADPHTLTKALAR